MARKTSRRKPKRPRSHDDVVRILQARMAKGAWREGEALPSLRALAKAYAVGVKTVRLALRRLAQDGQIRVVPRRGAVRLGGSAAQRPWTQEILMLLAAPLQTAVRSSYFEDVQRGVLSAAGRMGSGLCLVGDAGFRTALPEGLLRRPLRGILLWGHFQKPALQQIAASGWPATWIDSPRCHAGIHTVAADNFAAADLAVQRLWALGHRRIAFVQMVSMAARDIDPDQRERQRGFRQALARIGGRRTKGEVFICFASDAGRKGRLARLFDARPPITAVLSSGRTCARVIQEAAASAGRSIPRDLSMALVQSRRLSEQGFGGPVIDFEAMGRDAAGLLAGPRSPSRQVRIQPHWMDGATIAAPLG